MRFLGIYREPEYSPGRHTSNDARILRLVGQALERLGVGVTLSTLEEARPHWKEASLIFSMCQGPAALTELAEWKKEGARILNDPAASRRTYRDTLCATLLQKGLPFPRSVSLPTDGSADLRSFKTFFEKEGAWLKRFDVHAMQTGDVARIERAETLAPALESFRKRGLTQAVLQEHVSGDEVKFYAVRGEALFWPYYPKESQGHPFDEHRLRAIAEETAAVLDIDIYGGDAIISPEGAITLIDLNDWPSFAPCRGAAAHAIALYLKEMHHALQNSREISKI